MATLLAIHRPGGRSQRCDARCYNARAGSACDCICGGANHARGLRVALLTTRQLVAQWIVRAREEDPEITSVEVGLEAQTIPLFE